MKTIRNIFIILAIPLIAIGISSMFRTKQANVGGESSHTDDDFSSLAYDVSRPIFNWKFISEKNIVEFLTTLPDIELVRISFILSGEDIVGIYKCRLPLINALKDDAQTPKVKNVISGLLARAGGLQTSEENALVNKVIANTYRIYNPIKADAMAESRP